MSPRLCARCGARPADARRLCSSCYCRAWRAGQLPARNEIDEAAVLRLMAGVAVDAIRAEHREATRRLTLLGMSAAAIAERIGRCPRTVARYRATEQAA